MCFSFYCSELHIICTQFTFCLENAMHEVSKIQKLKKKRRQLTMPHISFTMHYLICNRLLLPKMLVMLGCREFPLIILRLLCGYPWKCIIVLNYYYTYYYFFICCYRFAHNRFLVEFMFMINAATSITHICTEIIYHSLEVVLY